MDNKSIHGTTVMDTPRAPFEPANPLSDKVLLSCCRLRKFASHRSHNAFAGMFPAPLCLDFDRSTDVSR